MKPFLYLGLHAFVFMVLLQTGHATKLEKRIKLQMLELPKPQVCYAGLGCFKQDYPFVSSGRPVYNPPASPEGIGTQFLLYTRENRNNVQILDATNETTITTSNFRATRNTTIIIHGFTSNGYSDWVVSMTQELLAQSDVNVIAVNWGNGAEFPYIQAASNIRVVAAQVAQLLGVFNVLMQVQAENVYIIGHSLGAHCAGYVGKRIPNIRRITGLEPASILFYENIPKLRLFRTDAKFVDIIHTNCGELGFGLGDQVGHADYYVNNAEFQPGCIDDTEEVYGNCLKTTYEEITKDAPIEPLTCSHHRAIDYFTESINEPCFYWAFECQNLDSLTAGDCFYCRVGITCDRMGFHAVHVNHAVNRTYRLTTGDTSPFCRSDYRVDFKTGFSQMRPTVGTVSISALAKYTTEENGPMNTSLTFAFPTSEISRNVKKMQQFQHRIHVHDFSSSNVTFQKNSPSVLSFIYDNSLYIWKIGIESINETGTIRRTELCGDTPLNSADSPTATFRSDLCTIYGSTLRDVKQMWKQLHLQNRSNKYN